MMTQRSHTAHPGQTNLCDISIGQSELMSLRSPCSIQRWAENSKVFITLSPQEFEIEWPTFLSGIMLYTNSWPEPLCSVQFKLIKFWFLRRTELWCCGCPLQDLIIFCINTFLHCTWLSLRRQSEGNIHDIFTPGGWCVLCAWQRRKRITIIITEEHVHCVWWCAWVEATYGSHGHCMLHIIHSVYQVTTVCHHPCYSRCFHSLPHTPSVVIIDSSRIIQWIYLFIRKFVCIFFYVLCRRKRHRRHDWDAFPQMLRK